MFFKDQLKANPGNLARRQPRGIRAKCNAAFLDIMNAISDDDVTKLHPILEKTGFDINRELFDGKTILHATSETSKLAIVRYLLSKGANIHILDTGYNTPYHLAAKNGHSNILDLFLEKDPAVATHFSASGNTVLHYAARNGHFDCVSHLLNNSYVNLDFRNADDKLASELAADNGHNDIANLFEQSKVHLSVSKFCVS